MLHMKERFLFEAYFVVESVGGRFGETWLERENGIA